MTGRFCHVPEKKMSIFDSLVLILQHDADIRLRHRKRGDNGVIHPTSGFKMKQSQQTLNCALLVDFLWKQRLKIGRTCVGLRAGTDYRMVRFCRPRSGVRRKLFDSLTRIEPFFTESLILAQNERWRRG
jgi:hypothetical protein